MFYILYINKIYNNILIYIILNNKNVNSNSKYVLYKGRHFVCQRAQSAFLYIIHLTSQVELELTFLLFIIFLLAKKRFYILYYYL